MEPCNTSLKERPQKCKIKDGSTCRAQEKRSGVGAHFSAPQHISGFLVYISYYLAKSVAYRQLNFPTLPQEMDLGCLQELLVVRIGSESAECWEHTFSLLVSVHHGHHQTAGVTALNVTKNLFCLEHSLFRTRKIPLQNFKFNWVWGHELKLHI